MLTQTLSFLDNPKLNWKTIIVGFTVGQFLFENYLLYRQYQVLKRKTPPPSLKAEIPQDTFDKSQAYSRAKARFGFFSSALLLVQNLAIIKYDLLPYFWNVAGSLMGKSASVLPKFMAGTITQSLFFLNVISIVQDIVGLPTSYYFNFVLEEKFGFNKLTQKLWIVDMIKSAALRFAFVTPILAGFLKILDHFGESFIVYMCVFVLALQLIGMTIFPILIQPLFNKFTPLEDGKLKTSIENLAAQQNFPLNKLYVIDGSKRSSHSNAYFTGLPWSKQIVLYDTLIEKSSVEETVAVVAHEIGHWKLSHLVQMLAYIQGHMLLVFSLFSAFIHNNSLYRSFGFSTQPAMIGFMLFNDIFNPVECVMQFAQNLLSRKNEYEADAFAKEQGYSEDLCVALIKMLSENLSTMDADWVYSSYHHSHPILSERLGALGYVSKKKIA